jgi:hypothetical protein
MGIVDPATAGDSVAPAELDVLVEGAPGGK